MNKLVVKKSSIIINDYTWGDCKKLENFFSIFDPIYHSVKYIGIEYNNEMKQLRIPRGVDVSYVETLLGCCATFDDIYDPYDKIDNCKLKYLPRDERQVQALQFILGESNDFKHNKYKSQLGLNLPTGAGKTYCSIAAAMYLQERVAILTSSINWLEQWKKCILEYTDIKPREIYFLSGSASIHSILKQDMSRYKIILVSIATIRSYGDSNGWDKVSELFKHLRIGRKFYDECHTHFEAMCRIDYWTNTKCTYYISATLQRSDPDEDRIYQLYFKNIPSIDLFDEEDDPHTHYIGIKYNSNPDPRDISNCRNKYGLDRNKYTNYVVNQENYLRILDIIVDIGMHKDGKVLIFIGTQNAIDITYNYMIEKYPFLYGNIGIFTSKTEGDKKEELKKKFILSTTKSCGAAVDIAGLIMSVVLAEPFKSEVIAKQSLGRTRADNTFYIEIVDTGFKKISQYYYQKKGVFNTYALDCSEIKLLGDELEYKWADVEYKRDTCPMHLMFMPEYVPYNQGLIFEDTKSEKFMPLQFM